MPKISDATAAPNPASATKPAIVLHEVTKTFRVKHTQSFKETLIASLKRKPISTVFTAVDNLSIEVPVGESVAVMGRNGSGKSTTLKMLSGVLRPDAGWIRIRGRVAGLLEVGAGFHPDLTGRENVYLNAAILGMTKEETEARFDDILEFSEIGEFIDTEVKHYSSGMYSRLGFAVAVHTEFDVLLVDEVLSVGDAQFREKCNVRIKELTQLGKTVFVVSHNTSQVREICERGIVLENGKMVFDGPIETAVEFIKPKLAPIPGAPDGGFPITGPIERLHAQNPTRWGRALREQEAIAENGGGFIQEFERGILTTSKALKTTKGIARGAFCTAYLKHGGPAGRWGFLNGTPTGSSNEGTRELRFQYGQAAFDPELGVYFTPND
ncbi:ATP-binding cassette domain-containing protein [Leucobacter sp. HY1910]